jgi:hypothetical protein
LNLHQYASNPIRWIDPSGLAGTTVDGKGNVIPLNDYGVPDKTFEPKPGIGPYSRNSAAGPTSAQTASVQGKPCVVCNCKFPRMIADHIDGLAIEHYRTGANDIEKQTSVAAVQPHCPTHSNVQGGHASAFSKAMKAKL